MSEFKRYRSRVLVEAKPLDKTGTFYDPRTGSKQEFRPGDMLIREPSGKQRVVVRERFNREFEAVE